MPAAKNGERAAFETLLEFSSIINSTLEIAWIRKRAVEAGCKLTGAEAGSLLFVEKETGGLYFDVATGDKGKSMKSVHLGKGQGIAGWVAENLKPAIVNNPASDKRFFSGADHKSGFVTKNIISIPVINKGGLAGVLQSINKKNGFNRRDLSLLTALSNQVAVAIENATLFEDLKEAFYSVTSALTEAIEKRDTYTAGHTDRVSAFSLAIGKVLGLTRQEMAHLRLAAVLHDIGKIGVSDKVLLKKGELNRRELQHMQKHVEYGEQILKHIKQLEDVIPGVKCHHEHYDGSGYPDGISGRAIPLSARIIAVADTFDAMTTDRPYRKGLSPDTAFAELKKCCGTQFDARMVRAFLKAAGNGEINIAKDRRKLTSPAA